MNMKYAMGATRFTLVLTAVGMMGLSGAAIAGAAPRIDRPQAERIALAHAPGGLMRFSQQCFAFPFGGGAAVEFGQCGVDALHSGVQILPVDCIRVDGFDISK